MELRILAPDWPSNRSLFEQQHCWAWSALARGLKPPKPKGPHYPARCPVSCLREHRRLLNYDATAKCVLRKMQAHYGCVLKQPVAPSLRSLIRNTVLSPSHGSVASNRLPILRPRFHRAAHRAAQLA